MRPTLHRTALVTLCLALVSATVASAQRPELGASVDSIVRTWMAGSPHAGMSVGVTIDGAPVRIRGYGVADLENDVPASSKTVYQIASLTKQFTAVAVLRLVERGRIALDDPVADHVPRLASLGRTATVRQLLSHTSGLAADLGPEAQALLQRPFTSRDEVREEYLRLVLKAGFDTEPGERYRYSNQGYWLLGHLIETVTGRPWGEHLRTELFEPLGMTRTSACPRESIVEGRASGYDVDQGRLVNAPFVHQAVRYSAGALCSTVEDLLRWNSALHQGEILPQDLYQAMTRPGPSGTYGYGIGIVDLEGRPYFDHGGWVSGFTARLDYFPDERMSVVVLSNTAPSSVPRVGRAIARKAFGLGPAPPMSHDH